MPRIVCVSEGRPYVPQAQAGPQAVDDVLGQVGVDRVPHQADGNDLGRVHQHPTNAQLLATVTLHRGAERERGRNEMGEEEQNGMSQKRTQI